MLAYHLLGYEAADRSMACHGYSPGRLWGLADLTSHDAKDRRTTPMNHAELAAKLLREAATIFRSLGAPDPELGERLDEFASVYEQVADLVERDPRGVLELAERLAERQN